MNTIPRAFIIRGVTQENRPTAASWVLNNLREFQRPNIISHLNNSTNFYHATMVSEWAFGFREDEPYAWYGWNPMDNNRIFVSYYQRAHNHKNFYIYEGSELSDSILEDPDGAVIIPVEYLTHFGNPTPTPKKPTILPKKGMGEIFKF